MTDRRPRLLDLFCGAGGCTVGYQRAGFDVTGVDIVRQPDYPAAFVQRDALTYLADHADEYDAVHASPPCKRWTPLAAGVRTRFPPLFDPHTDWLTPTLAALADLDLPVWIVENVPGAPMPASSLTLCGSMFGLRVRRHRRFAVSLDIGPPPSCDHRRQGQPVGVYGNGGADTGRTQRGGGGGVKVSGLEAATALGIEHTDRQASLAQAIPPAYTEWIGAQLLAHLNAAV